MRQTPHLGPAQSEPEVDPRLSTLRALDVHAPVRDAPAPPSRPSAATPPLQAALGLYSPPPPATKGSGALPLLPFGGGVSIPLHPPLESEGEISEPRITAAIPVIMACINMSIAIMHMYTTTSEATKTQLSNKKRSKRCTKDIGVDAAPNPFARHAPEEDELEHPHTKELFDLLAWHVHVQDAKWYVKPRSTCWFE